jgi:D-aspartate ligase
MPQFDTSVAALVLNFGEYPFHQGSLGVIRSLGSVGIPVFAIQRRLHIPSGESRYLRGKFLWNSDGKNVDHFLDGMATIAKKLDRPTILVPTDDLSAVLIAENSHLLSSKFTFPHPPTKLPRSVANKRTLYHTCRRLGIACPTTFFPESRQQLVDFAGQARFPVFVKAIESWSVPRGVKSTAIVSSRQELLNYCEGPWGRAPITSLMIQEMIPASVSEDWSVNGYCDKQSQPIALFTGIKFRSYPAFAGPATLTQSVRNDALEQQTVKLLGAIGYRGALDLDYRFDKRDGRYYLLDFNPRLGAQFRLFRTADGIDVVRTMHLDLTQRTPPAGRQVEGRKLLVGIQDLLASLMYFQNGVLTFKEWYRSICHIDETAWYCWQDPVPFLLMSLHMPWRAVTRARLLSIFRRRPKMIAVSAEDTSASKQEAVPPKQPVCQR